jgi:Dna[CI] antecedent, DciA
LHPPKADRYLIADEGMGPVLAKARAIGALTRSCAEFLPPGLARHLRAANLREGELSLLAANPAAAAKLKLVAESLRKFLLQQGTKVSAVCVRVQPTRSQDPVLAAGKTVTLSAGGIAELSALYDRLRVDSPARRALGALLRRQPHKTAPPPVSRRSAAKPGRTGKARS